MQKTLLSLVLMASASVMTAQAQTAVARTGGADYPSIEAAIEAAADNATVTLLADGGGITFSKCITLDMNGHTLSDIWVQNQQGTVTVKNGRVTNKIDGEDGDATAFVGNLVLDNLRVDCDVWVDGHYCYIKSGTYNSVNNHRCSTHYGTTYISGNNTFVGGFNAGGWNYDGGEIILLGGVYPNDPSTTWGRVYVDETRSVTVLSAAPAGAPGSNYIYQVYDDGSAASGVITFHESEPNNSWEEADEIAPNSITYAAMPEGDVSDDWFKVILPEEGNLDLTTCSDKSLELNYLEFYARAADGELHEVYNRWMNSNGWGDPITGTAEGLKAGTYYVRIRHNAGYGSYTFSTKFHPCAKGADSEPNDADYLALEAEINKEYQARLGYQYWGDRDTEDWYWLEVPEEGNLDLTTCSETTLELNYLEFYAKDLEGNLHEVYNRWMNSNGRGEPISGTAEGLKAGTYYVRIRHNGGYGGYTFSTKFHPCALAADSEPNDADYLALEAEINREYQARLGYQYWGDRDTEDWYWLEVPEEGNLDLTTCSETTLELNYLEFYAKDLDGELHQVYNKWMNSNGRGESISGTAEGLKAGTYYVRIRHNGGYGGYTFSTKFHPCALAADSEPNDVDYLALEAEINREYQARLGYQYWGDRDTEDWYWLEVPEEGNLDLTTCSETTLELNYLEFYAKDLDGNLHQVYNKWMNSNGRGESISGTAEGLKAGTYYVRIRHNGGYGGYTFSTKFHPCVLAADSEPNDNESYAQRIEVNQRYQARLGYVYWDDRDTEDWFVFDLDKESTLTFATCSETTLELNYLNVYIMNDDGSLKEVYNKYMNANGSGLTVMGTADGFKPGTYYVRIRRNGGYGGYSFGIDKGTESGIDAIAADAAPATYYDLAGRRCNQSANGIVVKNGRKTFVK